jgi:hypothetical protein
MKTIVVLIISVVLYSCSKDCKTCTDITITDKWVRPAGSVMWGLDKTLRDTSIFDACGDEINYFENQQPDTTEKMQGGAGYRTIITHQCNCN